MSGEGGDNDRKRRAPELDATVVAPKKKFLAAQAEAAEKKEQESSTPAKQSTGGAAAGAAAVAVKTEVKAEVKAEKGDVNSTSYSVRDNAPAGALADDSEEVLRFQNQQLYAALQSSKNENARLHQQVESMSVARSSQQAAVACVYRHWSVLTEELRSTFLRLENTPSDLETESHKQVYENLVALKALVPEDADAALAASCKVAQELMQEVVQSLMDVNARQQRLLSTLGDKSKGADVEAEIARASKHAASAEKAVGEMQAKFTAYTLEEGAKADAALAKAALVEGLQAEVEELRGWLEAAERRLVRSEENFRVLKESAAASGVGVGGKGGEGGSGDASGEVSRQLQDYRHQAETRLEEIKGLQQEILKAREEGANRQAADGDVPDAVVVASQAYGSLLEQLRGTKRECEAYHAPKIAQLTAEVAEGKERVYEERQKLEQQHNGQIRAVQARLSQLTNQLLEAKQEARSLQFKLDQKSACEISSKRAEELSEMLTKLQEEYKRLRTEHDALRQRPDAEELRREFREREEKICKERDIKQIEASDFMEQIRAQERKIAMLMQKSESGANGVNGGDSVAAKEVEALKKEVEGLRNDKKDLQRRLQKADRGFNDCNKLYQQVKKEKDAIMRDLESLGTSFEEMQEQNMRLLQNMKQRDEEQNELLRQRMKDKQQREMLLEEKSALKLKLEKAEELIKAREDAVDKCKIDMEQQRQEHLKRQKEEEYSTAIIMEHRKHMQQREQAAKEAKREAEKMKASLAEQQREQKEKLQALQDMQFDNNRLQEELASVRRCLTQNEKKGGGGLDVQQLQLLQHYRSRVKCHCAQGDKARVLPCGHASCVKCTESLIKERSRKCPACSKKFDQTEIRPLFLQGSTDEG